MRFRFLLSLVLPLMVTAGGNPAPVEMSISPALRLEPLGQIGRTPAQPAAPASGTRFENLGSYQLSWRNPPGTMQYQIQVRPHNDDGPGINLIRNAEENFTIQQPKLGDGNYVLLPDMTYRWRVRTSEATTPIGENDASWGSWSEERTFRTPPPSSTGMTSGLHPPEKPEPAVLSWSHPDPTLFYWEVQVSKDPNFDTNPATAVAPVWWNFAHGGLSTPPNSWTTPRLEPLRQYFWRVRPRVQGDGTPVPWGPAWGFRTAPLRDIVSIRFDSVQVLPGRGPGEGSRLETLVLTQNHTDQLLRLYSTRGPEDGLVLTQHGRTVSQTACFTDDPRLRSGPSRAVRHIPPGPAQAGWTGWSGHMLQYLADNLGRPLPAGRYDVRGVVFVTTDAHAPFERLETPPWTIEVAAAPPPTAPNLANGVAVRLSVPGRLRPGEPVPLMLSVQNITARALTLSHGGYLYDFAVYRDGSIVWSWSCGFGFNDALHQMTLQPGEVREFKGDWKQRDLLWNAVPPGAYEVHGAFRAHLGDWRSYQGVEETLYPGPVRLVVE